MPQTRLYVGVTANTTRVTFRSATTPRPSQLFKGNRFTYVIGPFRTKTGAEFMRNYGQGNPHCQCVADAEKIVKYYKTSLIRSSFYS